MADDEKGLVYHLHHGHNLQHHEPDVSATSMLAGSQTLSITTATTLHIVNSRTELFFCEFENRVFLVEMPAKVYAQIADSLLHVLDFGLNLLRQMEPCQSTSLTLLRTSRRFKAIFTNSPGNCESAFSQQQSINF